LIYLGVENNEELLQWKKRLFEKDLDWVAFQEPDLDNRTTAIACYCDGKVFSNLPLLK
jgi:hypothetical protein